MILQFEDYESGEKLFSSEYGVWPAPVPTPGDYFSRDSRTWVVRGRTFNLDDDELIIRMEQIDGN